LEILHHIVYITLTFTLRLAIYSNFSSTGKTKATFIRVTISMMLYIITTLCMGSTTRVSGGRSGPPQNLDGPPTYCVAFWWIM